MPPTGYHSPALTAESPTITHTEPRGTTRYIVDSGSQTSAAVTDIGWVSDGECPQGLNSPAVTERSTNHINQTMILAAPTMGLVDLPTSLVQHWFGSVCCYWSAFDSESNPFRSVAASLWGSSRVVFYSLQSMSAAALVEYMPNMKEITSSAPALAIEAISEELAELYTSDPGVVQFPKGLILALFCMGSSMCWDDPQRTGAHFFRQAKRLLRHFERRSESLSEGDRQLLDFFGGCMKYEEMLRDVAGERERENLPRASLGENRERQVSIKPHAWTGVSPDLLGLFGDAISLCRQECVRRQGHNNVTRESLRDALDAIDEAQALEEALLVVEPASLQPEDVHCADTMRWAHLRNTTEGYRLASLLQLYQTFPDLIARRIPGQIGADGLVPNSTWLVPLALHLTAILQRTPPSSDLRCIQPLLYLSAGSCLRYDEMTASSVRMGCTSGDIMGLLAGNTPESLPSLFAATPGISDEEAMFEDLGVSSARKLIMERLGELEHVLPPKPIRVAQQLMKATWHVFDSEVYAPRKTHWLDIMASTGLKTLFG